FAALTGSSAPPAPLLGGDLDHRNPGARLVSGLWPALWSRALRDVAGATAQTDDDLFRWASRFLAPEGPYPAVRVGEQPYGILPVTSLARWQSHRSDPDGEERIRQWAEGWRAMAAA